MVKKYYVGYHNNAFDMSDFTVLCETESQNAATGICEMYEEKHKKIQLRIYIYESRELPENAHY